MKARRSFAIGLLAVVTATAGALVAQTPQAVGTWAPLGDSAVPLSNGASVALPDGRMLIAGGTTAGTTPTDGVTIYDPVNGTVTPAGKLVVPRSAHAATLLKDGRVLIVGGVTDAGVISTDIERFDPATGTSEVVGQLAEPRRGHVAAALLDGTVLIAGGATTDGLVLQSAAIFNPETNSVLPLATGLHVARVNASATTLLDGRVLIVGGSSGSADLASAEIFERYWQTFAVAATQMSVPRQGHSAVMLPHNGGVLFTGGTSNGVATAGTDLFLPAVFPDPFSYGEGEFTTTGAMAAPRAAVAAGPMSVEGFAFAATAGARDGEVYRFATIKTDKDDYPPGERAIITGSGWQPGEDVKLLFQEDPAVHDDYQLTLKADAQGNLYYDQWAPEEHDLNVRFYLTATDSRSRAQVTFTDGRVIVVAVSAAGSSANIGRKLLTDTDACPGTDFDNDPTILVTDGTPATLSGALANKQVLHVTAAASAANGKAFTGWTVTKAGGGSDLLLDLTARTLCIPGQGQNNNGNQGTYTFTANYGSAAPVDATITVTPYSVTYDGQPHTATGTATGSSGEDLSSLLTLTGTTHTDTGTYQDSWTFAGNAQYKSASGTVTNTISRAPTTVTVTCPASVEYNGSAQTPCTAKVTGGGGLDQSLTVSYSNNTNAGTATASASYPESANHLAANGSKHFTIAKAAATVTVTCPDSVEYTGAAQTPCSATVTGSGGLNQALTVSYSNNTNAGTATASASYAESANHVAGSGSKDFTIAKAATTVTVTCPATLEYNGAAQTPCSATVTGNGGLDESLTVSYSNNTNAGIATASASYPESANHLASNGSKDFTITKAATTVTVTCPDSVEYNGGAQEPCSAKVTGAGGLDESLTVSYSNNTNAGIATASASYAESANHLASNGSKDFTITKAATTVTVACPDSVEYNGGAQEPCSAKITGAGGLDESLTVSYSNNTNAGIATASASYAESANHLASNGSKEFTIAKAVATVTVTCPDSVVYNGSAQEPCSATVTGAGGLNDTLTVNYTNNANAGTATASASYAESANHQAGSDSKTFTIAKAPVTVAVTCPVSVTYNGSAQEPCSASMTGAGGLNETLTVTYNNNTNAGTATASASYAESANHQAGSDSKTFAIARAPVTVTVSCPVSVTYNGSAQEPCSATVTGAGALNQALTVSYTNNTNAGTATSSASYAESANHLAGSGSENFAIAKAPVTVTVTCPVSVTYNGSAQTPCSATVTGAGGLNQSLAVGYSNNTNAGTATAGASYAESANHLGNTGSKEFTINRQTLTITPEGGKTKLLGATFTAFTGTVTGLQGSDAGTASYASPGAPAAAAIGSYDITATGFVFTSGNASNYYVKYETAAKGLVVLYRWDGFLQPINDTAHDLTVMSKFKLGQTIPAKFILKNSAGAVVQQTGSPEFTRSANLGACDTNSIPEDVPALAGDVVPQYKWDGSQYHYNWSTKGLTSGLYRIFATLGDGTTQSVNICLTK